MFSELLKYPKTFCPLQGGFEEWHKGRRKYCVWVVEPELDSVTTRFIEAQKYLSPYLIDHYDRKLHITIGQAGFWAEQKQYDDDYLMDCVVEDIEKLKHFSSKAIQCDVRNTLISYAIAPGFEIMDSNQHLSSLNQLLCRAEQDDTFVYFPHITVGLYNAEWDTRWIAEKLAAFPIEANIPLTMDKIKLISYEPAISGGRLEDELIFNLRTKMVEASRYPLDPIVK